VVLTINENALSVDRMKRTILTNQQSLHILEISSMLHTQQWTDLNEKLTVTWVNEYASAIENVTEMTR